MMKPLKETPVKTRRQYDDTFNLEAVRNWLASGKSAEGVSKELGLSHGRLFAWRKRLAPAAAGGKVAAGPRPSPGSVLHFVDSPGSGGMIHVARERPPSFATHEGRR